MDALKIDKKYKSNTLEKIVEILYYYLYEGEVNIVS